MAAIWWFMGTPDQLRLDATIKKLAAPGAGATSPTVSRRDCDRQAGS
jgi:hypothetical protein